MIAYKMVSLQDKRRIFCVLCHKCVFLGVSDALLYSHDFENIKCQLQNVTVLEKEMPDGFMEYVYLD